jgi:hypothetical protein
MRLLFVGESWLGSSARGLREALSEQPGVIVEEIATDLVMPSGGPKIIRAVDRIVAPIRKRELLKRVRQHADYFRPNIIIFYKGPGFDADFLEDIKRSVAPIVNVFPDFSPHAYGPILARSMGVYDLVISTKPFHPPNWGAIYGYTNRCVFVPHGYDSKLHLRSDPPSGFAFDVLLAASGRPEYYDLMTAVARNLPDQSIKVALAGPHWATLREAFPRHWIFLGPQHGMCYVETLRRARIVIAPVHSRVNINGREQPGDVDTTRTYELAAAHCFFIHRRTEFVRNVYDEETEVPMFDDPVELVEKMRYYLPHEDKRAHMAAAAHARAVPRQSLNARAQEIVKHLRQL